MSKKILCFDIETNGLYWETTTVHCMWIIDILSKEEWGFRPDNVKDGLKLLTESDILFGHNILDFDLPTLKKIYPNEIKYNFNVLDTLVLSRYLKPDRKYDNPNHNKKDPRYGPSGHGLKQWGVFLGLLKGDYGEEENAWEKFSEEMFEYNRQDVLVNIELYHYLCKQAGFDCTNPPVYSWKG